MLTATSRRFVCSSTTHPVADVGEDADVGVEAVRGDQGQAVGLLPVDQHSLCHADREESEPNLPSRSKFMLMSDVIIQNLSYFIEEAGAEDLLHAEAGQLGLVRGGGGGVRAGAGAGAGALRHQAQSDDAEGGQDPAQQQEAVGDAGECCSYRDIHFYIARCSTHFSRTASSVKYFSSLQPEVRLEAEQLPDTGTMLAGFTNAVSVGIHITEPKPYPLSRCCKHQVIIKIFSYNILILFITYHIANFIRKLIS